MRKVTKIKEKKFCDINNRLKHFEKFWHFFFNDVDIYTIYIIYHYHTCDVYIYMIICVYLTNSLTIV